MRYRVSTLSSSEQFLTRKLMLTHTHTHTHSHSHTPTWTTQKNYKSLLIVCIHGIKKKHKTKIPVFDRFCCCSCHCCLISISIVMKEILWTMRIPRSHRPITIQILKDRSFELCISSSNSFDTWALRNRLQWKNLQHINASISHRHRLVCCVWFNR